MLLYWKCGFPALAKAKCCLIKPCPFENCELKAWGKRLLGPLLELGCLIEGYKNKVAHSILPWEAHNRVHVINQWPVNTICWNLDMLVFMKEGKPEPETSIQNYIHLLVSVLKHLFMLFHSFRLLIFLVFRLLVVMMKCKKWSQHTTLQNLVQVRFVISLNI